MSFPSGEMFTRACEISHAKYRLKIRMRNNFFEFTSWQRSDEIHRNEEIKNRQKKSIYFNQKVPDETHRKWEKIHHFALKVSSGLALENNPAVPAVKGWNYTFPRFS